MWYNDLTVYRNFGEALANVGALADPGNAVLYFRKPQEFNDEYEIWTSSGSPSSSGEDGWEDFEDAFDDENEE